MVACCLSLATFQAADAATSVDPATYMHSVCTALGDYRTKLVSLQTSTDLASSTTLTEVRDKLVSFLTQATTASDATATALQSVGVPSIKNGDKVAVVIAGLVTGLRDAFAKATRSAQELDVSNAKVFKKQEQAISKQINVSGKKVKSVLAEAKKRYDIKALKAAQSQDPSCRPLR
jgi:hypothetical protein